jgi:uncharacterized protein GlcG (DUF336 family)
MSCISPCGHRSDKKANFARCGGGFPIVIKGEIVGATGLSGGHYTQDMECARAGLAAIGADAL